MTSPDLHGSERRAVADILADYRPGHSIKDAWLETSARCWLEMHVRSDQYRESLTTDPDGRVWAMAVDALALLDHHEAFEERIPAVLEWLNDIAARHAGPVSDWARWAAREISR